MKIINKITGQIVDILNVDTIRNIVSANIQDSKYSAQTECNLVLEMPQTDKMFFAIKAREQFLAIPENYDWVKIEDFVPNFQRFDWVGEIEHDFLYRVYLSDTDIKILTKEYFLIIEGIKSSPENPSVSENGGELIYVDTIMPEAYFVINDILGREFEANPRML